MAGHEVPHAHEPSIRNEFATAAYRMHGQVSGIMKAMSEAWKLISHEHSDKHDFGKFTGKESFDDEQDFLAKNKGISKMKFNFFDPEWLHTKGPGGCLRGVMKSKQLKMDGSFDLDLQHFLFKELYLN